MKLGIEGEDFQLTPFIKKYENKTLYKIEYAISGGNICVNYVDNQNKHVVFKNKEDEYVLFHIEGEPIREKMQESIEKALLKKRNLNINQDLIKDVIILQRCFIDIDLKDAQEELNKLNDTFEKKCPSLTLKLNHFFDFLEPMTRYNDTGHMCVGCKFYDTLILAICKKPNEKCISTIEIIFSPSGEVLINSKTDSAEEGKKYNKLLRNVLFIIAGKIKGAIYIKSSAFNPISAWLLLKYSNAEIVKGNPFEKYVKGKPLTQELLKEYYHAKNKPIELILHLNENTAKHSEKEFQKTIDEVKC